MSIFCFDLWTAADLKTEVHGKHIFCYFHGRQEKSINKKDTSILRKVNFSVHKQSNFILDFNDLTVRNYSS